MRANRPKQTLHDCRICGLRRTICVCPILPTVQTRTQVYILRHIREAGRPSNTGRLAALAMPNAELVDCGGGVRIGEAAIDETRLSGPGTWLLWPDGQTSQAFYNATPPSSIIVLDATWHQARRLYRRMAFLQSLPKLVLPAPLSQRDRLRQQRREDGLSTIEAIAAAIALLEGEDKAHPLLILYNEVVRRTKILRWGPPAAMQNKE